MNPLNTRSLGTLPQTVEVPRYDRSTLKAGIVHLGIGAFHRAHQAAYTDAVLATGAQDWGIVGAGVMSGEMKAALEPQDGLYVLAERGLGHERLRVIGAIVGLYGGPEDAAALLIRMSDPATRIVSLTVTEKGYFLDLATGTLQMQTPAIAADIAHPAAPKTALGLIVEALRLRRAAGIAPFTVMSCDNLPQNGRLAKAAVLAFAHALNPELADWIAAEVAFPCTMVDRITPATTDADREHIAAAIGLKDAWPVVTETFCQWVIEDHFTLGRPDWAAAGAIFSDEIEAWENMKLQCLNGAHSTLSYLAQLVGRETVADAMDSPMITRVLDPLWAEIREVLHAPRGVDTSAYVERLKERFRNPSLRHRTAQIASDGSQKLPQRLLAPLRERIARGLASPAITTAIAAWMRFVAQAAATPGTKLVDPLAETILAQVRGGTDAEDICDRLLTIEAIFGSDLRANADFRTALVRAYIELESTTAAVAVD